MLAGKLPEVRLASRSLKIYRTQGFAIQTEDVMVEGGC
jgi:hypothetical protein